MSVTTWKAPPLNVGDPCPRCKSQLRLFASMMGGRDELVCGNCTTHWPLGEVNMGEPIHPGGDVPLPEPVVINLLHVPVLLAWGNEIQRFEPEQAHREATTFHRLKWGPLTVLGPINEVELWPPPPVPGTIFIVSTQARLLYPERRDLFTLYHPTAGLDDDGQEFWSGMGLVGWPPGVMRQVVCGGPKMESSR